MRYSTAIISFLVGATAGGVGTYFATKKYFEDKADKEIADMKEFIRNRAKNTEESDDYDLEKYSMEEVLQNFCRNKFGQSFDIQLAEIDVDAEEEEFEQELEENYEKADEEVEDDEPEAPSDEESYHEESEEDILRRLKEEERKVFKEEGRRVISPYEVTMEEFEDASSAFDHTCLTYYMADETMLYDADGEKVDDVRRLIGQAGIDALNRQIAQKSGCFYICNKNFAQMYEVQVVDGTSGDYENYEAGFVNE